MTFSVFADALEGGFLVFGRQGLGELASGGTDAEDSGGGLEFGPLARGDWDWRDWHRAGSGWAVLDQRTRKEPAGLLGCRLGLGLGWATCGFDPG